MNNRLISTAAGNNWPFLNSTSPSPFLTYYTTSTTTYNLGWAGDEENDDIGFIIIAARGSNTPSTPSGWTLLSNSSYSQWSVIVFWKRLTGAQSTQTVNVGTAAVDKYLLSCSFRGCITSGDPYEDFRLGSDSGGTYRLDNNPTVPLKTPTDVDRLSVGFFVLSDNQTLSNNDHYSIESEHRSSGGADGAIYINTYQVPDSNTVAADAMTTPQNAYIRELSFLLIPNT